MTFSSSPSGLASFVEQPLPGASFVEGPARGKAAPERTAAPLDLAAERARAEEAGYARGLREGVEQAEAEQAERLRTALAALEAALAGLRERERAQAEALAQAGLGLALAAAKHLLRRELAQDLTALAPCLSEAFAALQPDADVVLALAPDDLARLRAGGAEALARVAETWHAQLVPDGSLAAGEARVEASGAQIELASGRVLAQLEAALREQLVPPERER